MNEAELGSGCILPLAQSAVTGAGVALLATGAGLWWGDPSKVGYMAMTFGAGAGCAAWLSGLIHWRRLSVPGLPDFEPAAPEPVQVLEPARVRVELSRDEGRHVQLIDLPATLDQLATLAGGLLSGATLSESQWTGAGAIFTRSQFAELRAALIGRGLAAWNNPSTPARGVALTRPGLAAMRHFASMAAASTPPGVTRDSNGI